nr:hypothetical protein [uncultured Rhodopila sp.]
MEKKKPQARDRKLISATVNPDLLNRLRAVGETQKEKSISRMLDKAMEFFLNAHEPKKSSRKANSAVSPKGRKPG